MCNRLPPATMTLVIICYTATGGDSRNFVMTVLAMFIDVRYFYLRLHYRTVRRDQMQRPQARRHRKK